jgi:hypothetical protein
MFRPLPALVANLLPPEETGETAGMLGRLRQTCEAVAEQHAPELLGDLYREEWLWLLAAAALEEKLAALPKSSQQSFEGVAKQLLPSILPSEVARRLDIHPARPGGSYTDVQTIAADFTRAIAPRTVKLLLKDRALFKQRVHVFLEHRALSNQEIQARSQELLMRCVPELADARLERFWLKTPVERLRTYPDELLCQTGRHFLDWGPLMEFLADPSAQPVQQERYLALVSSLKNAFTKRHRYVIAGRDAEDAVHTAILRVIETLDDPWRGYIYESNFVAWLTVTITNISQRDWREMKREASFNDFDD